MDTQPSTNISLEELSEGYLPPHVIEAIDQIELTLADLREWENSKPSVSTKFKEGSLSIHINIKVPMGKLLLLLSLTGSGGALWAIVKWLIA